jgi:hypothetical protein
MIPVARNISVLLIAYLATACAAGGDTGKVEACPSGMTVYCETYLGKPQRCFCATRDRMQDVLEPVQEPY